MTKYEFVERLSLEIRLVNEQYKTLTKIKNLYPRVNDGELLSKNDYAQIVAFRKFIERERDLNDEQMYSLVLLSRNEFPFIYDLVNKVSNVIDELRTHGATSVAMMYRQRKLIENKNKELAEKFETINVR